MLYTLRNHCKQYIHGHSAGGTNPSLVEAMHFGKPILVYDVVYNRETTEGKVHYFKDSCELAELITRAVPDGSEMRILAEMHYTWKRIAEQYESIY